MRALTGNRLADGETVFWNTGRWVERFIDALSQSGIKGKYVNTWWIPSEVLHRVPDADTPPIKGDKM